MLRRRLTAFTLLLMFIATPALAEKRAALVIGNSGYQHAAALPNPANDARDMAAALTASGFEVVLGIDLDRRGFDDKVRAFTRLLEKADVALLYYAGHGLQVSGANFLVPVDARLETERDLDFETVRLDFVLRQMELGREGRTSIVFLDACRDNPLARNLARTMGTRSAALGQGLAQVQTGVGTFIAYSTQPGNVALDGTGRNSPFTAALVRRVSEEGRSLTNTMIEVRKDVISETRGKQVPWDHSALTGEFYFRVAAAGAAGALGAAGKGATGAGPAPGSGPDAAAMEARIRQLEQQLKSRPDPADTQQLLILKERKRQAEEALMAARRRVSDAHLALNREKDQAGRDRAMKEVLAAQRESGQRQLEISRVNEEIATLEAKVGGSSQPAPAKAPAN